MRLGDCMTTSKEDQDNLLTTSIGGLERSVILNMYYYRTSLYHDMCDFQQRYLCTLFSSVVLTITKYPFSVAFELLVNQTITN